MPPTAPIRPRFFPAPAAFRRWLEQHHSAANELWVGFYKKSSGRGGMVYAEAVDEALCFGWIDGLVKSIDSDSYMQRFTPRKPRSIWSKINVGHIARLTAAGRMTPAGLAAFEARTAAKTGVYSFEQEPQQFPAAFEKTFRANRRAWTFWTSQPPGYKRTALWWVISAKQASARERRLAQLIAVSADHRRLQGK